MNFSETVSFRHNFNNYLGINGSYKKNRLTLKANLAYDKILQWESHRFAFDIPERDIFSEYEVLIDANNRRQINIGSGVFYQLNEEDFKLLSNVVKTCPVTKSLNSEIELEYNFNFIN